MPASFLRQRSAKRSLLGVASFACMVVLIAGGCHERASNDEAVTAPPSLPGFEAPERVESFETVPACETIDPAFADTSFVVATEPTPGERITGTFLVRGCSRTFESTVLWRLVDRDGATVAEGYSTGGGVDGAGEFSFEANVPPDTLDEGRPEVVHLEVWAPDPSDGEGYQPGRTVVPLVLVGGPLGVI